mmetsp:Transcript_10882/g.30652  ORF Transcript_10882/g.30652 Transcript_10882/m.30652 type:complete len:257 (+) Transcript_10882:387-1157(+)
MTRREASPWATSWTSSWTAGRRRSTPSCARPGRQTTAWPGERGAARSSAPGRPRGSRRQTRGSGWRPGHQRAELWRPSRTRLSAWPTLPKPKSQRRPSRGWRPSCPRSWQGRSVTSTSRAMPRSLSSLRPGGTAPRRPSSGGRASGSGCCRRRGSSCGESSAALRHSVRPGTATRLLPTLARARRWPPLRWARQAHPWEAGQGRPCPCWRAPSRTSASACGPSATVLHGALWRRPSPSTAAFARTRRPRRGRSGSW